MKGFIALLTAAFLALLMVACGGNGEGPELGDFPAITKTKADPPFNLTAPSSRSPGPFTFTSSNVDVATIDGTLVTIHAAGKTTITATQPEVGSYGPTSKSTTLTVTGDTTPSVVCVLPATLNSSGNRCVATIAPADTVTVASLLWARASRTDTAPNAAKFCTGTVINDAAWRQPTAKELTALYNAKNTTVAGWKLGAAWSSDLSTTQATKHVTVNVDTGAPVEAEDTATASITCVR
jgi:hypothetical protein